MPIKDATEAGQYLLGLLVQKKRMMDVMTMRVNGNGPVECIVISAVGPKARELFERLEAWRIGEGAGVKKVVVADAQVPSDN
jgi:hypothetical protein